MKNYLYVEDVTIIEVFFVHFLNLAIKAPVMFKIHVLTHFLRTANYAEIGVEAKIKS